MNSPSASASASASAVAPVAASSGAPAFGPLASYLADPSVTDVFVNGHRELWVDRGGGAQRDPSWSCPSEQRLREFAVRLVARGGRHIDESTPCVDVRLEGRRVHVVLPPISTGGTLISVRAPQRGHPRLDELDRRGLFGAGEAGAWRRVIIEEAVRERTNLLISGAGGSGKTTLLSALLAEADAADRIVLIEDVSELRVEHPHVIGLEARQPNLEGAGAVGLAELVRQALRMRPDRLVLGECRGAEIRELLSALNTGHDGGAGTLHANSIDDVPARLEALGALAGLTAEAIARQAVSAIGLVCHLRRTSAGRQIEGFGRLVLDARDHLGVQALVSLETPAADARSSTQGQFSGRGRARPGDGVVEGVEVPSIAGVLEHAETPPSETRLGRRRQSSTPGRVRPRSGGSARAGADAGVAGRDASTPLDPKVVGRDASTPLDSEVVGRDASTPLDPKVAGRDASTSADPEVVGRDASTPPGPEEGRDGSRA